jgi:protein-tyrosine phosphatase
MGGHVWVDSEGEHPAVAGRQFDLVISLFTRGGHDADRGVEHLVHELPDSALNAEQISAAKGLARTAAQAVRDRRNTLVRCHSGYNRSGLVVAQTVIELGDDAATAIGLIRARRSPWALNNQAFEQYLAAGLDAACLLVGLESPG